MPSKKPNPVPDPIVPPELACRVTHYHIGNRTQKELYIISGVKKAKYVTVAEVWRKEEKEDKDPIASAISVCGPKDSPNKRFGTIEAVHAAVKKVNPNFYKERRFLLSGKNLVD